jgi:uncharacterized membrane protein
MEEIIVFGIIVLILVVVIPIYLLVAVNKLKTRIRNLELALQAQTTPLQTEAPLQPPSPQAPPPSEAPPAPSKPQTGPSAWQPVPKVRPAPKAFVFSGKKLGRFSAWAQDNWVFILAGVSLVLAGVFLVQYGVENGLLTPKMRVLGAIGLGFALMGGGEYIRRKTSGDEAGNFALLPSVFAGAGLVAVFVAVLSAHMLYGLIGPETAMLGLALTGALAVLLGWVYGPLLAMLGVFGALLAPFLLGSNGQNAGPLHLYFAFIAAVGLAIDAYKRWAWLSALALIGAFAASWGLLTHSDTGFYAILFAFVTALLASILPPLSLTPRHRGARLSGLFAGGLKTVRIGFPTRVAGGGFLAATAYIWLIYADDATLFWLALMAAGLLLLAAIFWMKDAPALADLALAPPALALAIIAYEAFDWRPELRAWLGNHSREIIDTPSLTVAILLAGAVATSLAFAWRSRFRPSLKTVNAMMGAGFAPAVAIVIELQWQPSYVLGAGSWAIYLALIAALMVGLTERFARQDTADNRTRTALFALSSMSMLAFVAVVLLGGVALTLAFAVMVLAAAWLGRRFKLGLLDWYIQIGALAVSFRLVIEPGGDWAMRAPLWAAGLAFVGSLVLLAAAWRVKRGGRLAVVVVLESSVWTLSGVFISLMLGRWLDAGNRMDLTYVALASGGMVWLVLAANQLYRLKAGGRLHKLRIGLAGLYSLAGLGAMVSAIGLNPALAPDMRAIGWPVFGSLGVAFLLPALLFSLAGWAFTHLPRWLRSLLWALSAALGALFVALEIRHFWQGDAMAAPHTGKPELYSYTVAMILAAMALLALAFLRQSAGLRKLALVMVVLVVAKVYFVDISGLDGLLRVVSFLVLGLVAALMAGVNRLLKRNEALQATPKAPAPPP